MNFYYDCKANKTLLQHKERGSSVPRQIIKKGLAKQKGNDEKK